MDQNLNLEQDPYKGISKVVEQLINNLNQAQQYSTKEALNDNSNNNSIFLIGKSLVNLICNDFCMSKYPFRNSDFDYDDYVSNFYLESQRYDWLIESIRITIEDQWQIDCERLNSIQILYILSGAYTLDTNNKQRQKKISDLKQILYFIFELNFIATYFTRPTFNQTVPYKSIVKDVSQKIENELQFNNDIDSDDMKNPLNPEEGFTQKSKQTVFKSTLNFFGVVLVSLGEPTKIQSQNLLSKEILYLLMCFKECEIALPLIEQKLMSESQQLLENKRPREILFFAMNYMEYYAQKNLEIVEQKLNEIIIESQQQDLNKSHNNISQLFTSKKNNSCNYSSMSISSNFH